jgi:CelD/BcsL family acetyltransferase involved in cellulose biosynthesis
VRASTLALGDLGPRELERWRELAARAAEPNPFFEPEYVLPAARLIGGRKLGLAVAQEGGRWAACLPVHRPRRWHRVPLRCVASWQHRYCFLGTPLVRADTLEEAIEALADELRGGRRTSFVGLDALADEGAVRETLRSTIERGGGDEVAVNRHDRAVLRRRPAEQAEAAVAGKHRRELNRKRRRLAEELGAPLATVDLAEDAGALERFLELEASGWKGRSGTALASMDQDAEFFRAMCASFRKLGRFHLLSLQADGHPIAMACNLRAGEGVFCLKIAFDERWRRYSPGALLILDHLSWFDRQTGAAWMDSCVQPENELVNRLWPDTRPIATLAIPADSARGRLAGVAIKGAVRVRRRYAERR